MYTIFLTHFRIITHNTHPHLFEYVCLHIIMILMVKLKLKASINLLTGCRFRDGVPIQEPVRTDYDIVTNNMFSIHLDTGK